MFYVGEHQNKFSSGYFPFIGYPCQQKALSVTAKRLIGSYVPQCNPDGSYRSVQCHASTGYCWCADPDGTKWPGTDVRGELPKCEKSEGWLLTPSCVLL